MEKILLVGFGGHARSMIDCIEVQKVYEIAGYTDLKDRGEYRGVGYLGTDSELEKIYAEGIHKAALSLFLNGRNDLRRGLYKKMKKIGYSFPVIIDPSAVLAKDVVIGEGSYIAKRAVINSATEIGEMCIINTGAIIEHDNKTLDFCHISVGAVLCGGVKVGSGSFIGANATVLPGLKIGNESIVGAGSTVLRDVEDGTKVYGIVH